MPATAIGMGRRLRSAIFFWEAVENPQPYLYTAFWLQDGRRRRHDHAWQFKLRMERLISYNKARAFGGSLRLAGGASVACNRPSYRLFENEVVRVFGVTRREMLFCVVWHLQRLVSMQRQVGLATVRPGEDPRGPGTSRVVASYGVRRETRWNNPRGPGQACGVGLLAMAARRWRSGVGARAFGGGLRTSGET